MNQNKCSIEHYSPGMKIEVGIPLPDSNVFRDWAIINKIEENLVSLQLSRDILPTGVNLRVGQTLLLHSEHDFQLYSNHASVVSKGFDQELLLHLSEATNTGKLREFYRIDTFLPVKFHTLDDQDPLSVKKLWETRQFQRQEDARVREKKRRELEREMQLAAEEARLEQLLNGVPIGVSAESTPNSQDEWGDNEYHAWGDVVTAAVNISGGGLKIVTSQQFNPEEFILLELFMPSSRCIVEIGARVVFSQQVDATVGSGFHTGLHFMFIDEAARFAISKHISSLQLRQIRHYKGFSDLEPLTVKRDAASDTYDERQDNKSHAIPGTDKHRRVVRAVLFVLLMACTLAPLYITSAKYIGALPKNQIQVLFENEISKLAR